MWSNIELREIRVFIVLAHELSFTRAAERLGLASSRVSQIIRDLERKLGQPLVYRTTRRVELASFGERFMQEAGQPYQQLLDALRQFDAHNGKEEPVLRLGLFSDPTVSRVPRIVRTFERHHPGCSVQAAEVPLDDPFRPLRRHEHDVVASWLPHGQSGLVVGPILSREPRVLAMSADHPLAKREAVSTEDVADYQVTHWDGMPRQFHETWIPSKTPAGRPIIHRPFSNQSLGDRGRMTSELLYLIATGRVVHPTVPSFANMFGHPDIVHVPISNLPPMRSALVWQRGANRSLLREFVDTAREVVRSRRVAQI